MPPQIVRLVLLTIGIVCVYFTARYFLTPESFGRYGYECGNALKKSGLANRSWAGRKACDECHEEVGRTLAKAEHQVLLV